MDNEKHINQFVASGFREVQDNRDRKRFLDATGFASDKAIARGVNEAITDCITRSVMFDQLLHALKNEFIQHKIAFAYFKTGWIVQLEHDHDTRKDFDAPNEALDYAFDLLIERYLEDL